MKKLSEFINNNKVALLSGLAIIAVMTITLAVEYTKLEEAGGLTTTTEPLLKGSFLVIISFVLFVTYINLRTAKKREKQVEKQLGNSDTLINCITVLAEEKDINKAVDQLLKILNDYFDGDRAYLFEFDYENQVTNNSYE